MFSDAFFSALGVVYALIALFVYASLVRQIAVRLPADGALEPIRHFGFPEAVAGTLLAGWFVLNLWVAISIKHDAAEIGTRELLIQAFFAAGLVVFLAAYLWLRGFSIATLGGFNQLGFGRVVSTGTILLFAAYPLIYLADLLTRRLLGAGLGKQEIIELFNNSQTLTERIIIIVMAVSIAPIAEEFIFRFFLYGVLKRYFGRFLGVTVNALLFGAVHAHLPSFGPLFILGCCFTIAYEWSGSILVPMTMHALFNAFMLTLLAFPQTLPQ